MLHSQRRDQNQRKVAQDAVNLANKRMREEILQEAIKAYFDEMPVDIAPESMSILQHTWNPWNAMVKISSSSGLGVFIEPGETISRQVMTEEDLYDESYAIVMESFFNTYFGSSNTEEFLTVLLTDLLIEEKPFYKVTDNG